MRFTEGGDGVPVDDGAGGRVLDTTWELDVLEGTGIYRSLARGHNHMVDRLHFLANGDVDEFCFCNIGRP